MSSGRTPTLLTFHVSIPVLVRISGLNRSTIQARVDKGLGLEQILSRAPLIKKEPAKKRGAKPKLYAYRGKMVTLEYLESISGVKKRTLWNRIERQGLSIEAALMRPVRCL